MDNMLHAECSIDGCAKPQTARGWCSSHYNRWRRYGDPLLTKADVRQKEQRICALKGCASPVVARSMCQRHYNRWRLTGSPFTVEEKTAAQGLPCQAEGCERQRLAGGLCRMHYNRLVKRGTIGGGAPETPGKVNDRTCGADGCNRPHQARGMCAVHYKAWRKKQGRGPKCSVDRCDAPVDAKGMCSIHYERWRAHGDPHHERYRVDVGTRRVMSGGYIKVKVGKDAPYHEGDGWIREHRLVMAQHIGRALRPEENVHHLNGDRADNRICNLEIWNVSQPAGQRPQDLVQHARYILELYGDSL